MAWAPCNAPNHDICGSSALGFFSELQRAFFADNAEVMVVPGRDHFTVLDALAEPGHDVLAAASRLLGL